MEENKKFKYKIAFTIIFILLMAIGFVCVMVKMIQENGKCVDDPFRYAAQRLNKSGGNYDCYCSSLDPRLLDFKFSAENGIEIVDPNKADFNFSNIQLKGGD